MRPLKYGETFAQVIDIINHQGIKDAPRKAEENFFIIRADTNTVEAN